MRTVLVFVALIACACGPQVVPPAIDAADTGPAGDSVAPIDAAAAPDVDNGPLVCASDKQCSASNQVCDTIAGQCVQCNDAQDCEADFACKAHHCLPPAKTCLAAKDCGTTLVCDKTAGVCVDCITTADCNEPMVCQETLCVMLACQPGEAVCTGNSVHACKADGSGFVDTACAGTQACQAGACLAKVCAPGQAYCQGNSAMTCNANGLQATESKACSASETCLAGACVAKKCEPGKVVCADGSTLATCKSDGTGFDKLACKDGEACEAGTCQGAVCAAGTTTCQAGGLATCKTDGSGWDVKACDDVNPCTTDGCSQAQGCTHTGAAGAACEDGNPCTAQEACTAQGQCAGGIALGCCLDDAGCGAGGDPCLGYKFCDKTSAPYQCKIKPGTALQCDTSKDGACFDTKCQAKLGACGPQAKNENAPCDDGDACTAQDLCKNGACKGAASACDDKNPCTQDACGATGCLSTPLGDGAACGPSMVCKSGQCSTFCLQDSGCAAGCVCGKGTCQLPPWQPDGDLPFDAGWRLGYHPHLDEYWTFGSPTGQGKAMIVTRRTAKGDALGVFAMPNLPSNTVVWTVRTMAAEPGSDAWYFASADLQNGTTVGRMAGPAEAGYVWVTLLSNTSTANTVALDGEKLYAINGLQGGSQNNQLTVLEAATGKQLSVSSLNIHVDFLEGAAMLDGDLLTGVQSTVYRFKTNPFLQIESKQLAQHTSLTLRGTRLCLSHSTGTSSCYAMAKPCN